MPRFTGRSAEAAIVWRWRDRRASEGGSEQILPFLGDLADFQSVSPRRSPGPPQMRPHAPVLQSAQGGGAEPRYAVFQQVVVRSFAHRLHSDILADGARNDDER